MSARFKRLIATIALSAAFGLPALASSNCVCVAVCCHGGYVCFCNQ